MTGPGRKREYIKDIFLDIPDDYPIVTCTSCGERYFTTEESVKLEEVLLETYRKIKQC
jgi:hypothetical protein